MMRKRVIIRNAIKCKKCGKICESTRIHEFVKCDCVKNWVAADGGMEYLRRVGNPEDYIELSQVEERDIPVCEECMYYYEDQDIYYLGECSLLKCSQYGESKACRYFREDREEETDGKGS